MHCPTAQPESPPVSSLVVTVGPNTKDLSEDQDSNSMSGGTPRIAAVGLAVAVIGAALSFVPRYMFWRVNLAVFEITFIVAGVAIAVISLIRTGQRFTPKWQLRSLRAVLVGIILVLATYSAILIERHLEPLKEHDGAVSVEIQNLPRAYYTSWGGAWLYVYSGEPVIVEDSHLIVYPISASWSFNSTALAGGHSVDHDFGLRELGGAWFSLTVTDVKGDGRIGDGDRLRLHSANGSFSSDTAYFVQFGVGGPIAPFYVIYGFEISGGHFDSWVQAEPVEYAM